MGEAYVFDAVRTPRGRGRASGSLHEVSPLRLAAGVLKNIRDATTSTPRMSTTWSWRCVAPVGEQGTRHRPHRRADRRLRPKASPACRSTASAPRASRP